MGAFICARRVCSLLDLALRTDQECVASGLVRRWDARDVAAPSRNKCHWGQAESLGERRIQCHAAPTVTA
jgi:hypothetical protein